ncbi:MAG TPA: transaldolase [Candidatus Paceibacterota bacterium]|nr:transaldolase [Candidatus Paceibacterota bacterium]
MPKKLSELKIRVFADGAEKASMVALAKDPVIKGFTTNPTLMRKAGVTDYAGFAKEVLAEITDKPISFEVFSDEFPEMERQARIIAAWAPNVYVKIPVTNTRKESSCPLIQKLAAEGMKLNVTAILTVPQVAAVAAALDPKTPAIVSVFAGRIADTGADPVPAMRECKAILAPNPLHELLWASPRELLNIFQADEIGTDIITVTPEILKKAEKIGYDLAELSRDTVQMFYDDGQKAGYSLN